MQNYAFIDSQNLALSIKNDGWKLDFKKFKVYLEDKYKVTKAFLFMGFIDSQKSMYSSLIESGFDLVFKPTSANYYAKRKGSVEVEMTLRVMVEYAKFNKAVIVSGDGDYYCLIDHLKQKGKLEKVLAPSKATYSRLIGTYAAGKLDFMNNFKNKLEYVG